MRISKDKIKLLNMLHPGNAFIVSGEAGTGKTTAGILCGKKLLLRNSRPWQKVLYLTYSKLSKQQIMDCLKKLEQEGVVARETTKRMEILNYHSLWWNLICQNYSFLGIQSRPIITTAAEAKERAKNVLAKAERQGLIPTGYQRSDGRIDRRIEDDIVSVLMGITVVYAQYGPENFGSNGKNFIGEDQFLSWAKSEVLTWNRKGLFWHDETVYWALKLLEKHPSVLNLINVRYSTIIIDEFQDTDIAQWAIIQHLRPKSIIVMADPKQTIHRWRGADPHRMEQFERHFNQSGKYGAVKKIRLTEKNRAKRDMSKNKNIKWETVKLKNSSQGLMNKFRTKTKIICKSNALNKVNKNEDQDVAILCRTNRIADEVTNYLRRTQKFSQNKILPPLNCTRFGAENSPYEESRRIVLLLLRTIDERCKEDLQTYLANQLLRDQLPDLPQNELPDCTNRSRGKNKKRWLYSGKIANIMAEDFGLSLVNLRNYICKQASAYSCYCDMLTVNCINYLGRSIQRIGKKSWQNLSTKNRRQKIDTIITQYEKASTNKKEERLSVMTVHQSKSREFNIVIVPWFAKIDWVKGNFGSWNTNDSETENLFHTACTRAKEEVIVISPHGYEAIWPPQ